MCKLSAMTTGTAKPGITIEFFIKNCTFLMAANPEISKRILIAAGKFYFIKF